MLQLNKTCDNDIELFIDQFLHFFSETIQI